MIHYRAWSPSYTSSINKYSNRYKPLPGTINFVNTWCQFTGARRFIENFGSKTKVYTSASIFLVTKNIHLSG